MPDIDHFLNTLQRAKRLPNRRELFLMRQALVNLEKAEYPAGEEAMERAEGHFPLPRRSPTNRAPTPAHQSSTFGRSSDEIMKTGA